MTCIGAVTGIMENTTQMGLSGKANSNDTNQRGIKLVSVYIIDS
jgi:hypothetical protein